MNTRKNERARREKIFNENEENKKKKHHAGTRKRRKINKQESQWETRV